MREFLAVGTSNRAPDNSRRYAEAQISGSYALSRSARFRPTGPFRIPA